MLRKILNQMSPDQTEKAPSLRSMNDIRSFERDGLRVRVFRHAGKNGHFEYWFVIEQSIERWKYWFKLAALPDGQLQTIIDLLQKSLDSLDRGWRQLPSITIRGKTYFVDDKLMQLRNVSDPQDIIELQRQD